MRWRDLVIWRRTGKRTEAASHRILQGLLCALILTIGGGTLLAIPPVDAAPHTSFYGVSAARMRAASDTDTPTSTSAADTPTATAAATETPTPVPTSTPTPAPTATAPTSTVLDVRSAASAAGWPQRYSNWCGIATVSLVANFLGNAVSQSAIYNMINASGSQSMWGYPPPSGAYYGPYIAADISGDFGTDPRSLAEGMTLATGRLYHVKVGLGGSWDTTVHVVHDLLTTRQPISVFVDHGQHSVIVSGVDATGDPLTNPNSITAIHVWDPGGGVNMVGIQATQEAVVSKSMWLSGNIPWSGSSYFKTPYAANMYNGKALDPDPSVGPYAYVPAQVNHLWIGHYVYVSPLASADSANLSPDWELNQYGVLIAGLPNNGPWPNLPDGYTGASVPMPTNPPPPPPPVKPPVIAPKRAPLPPPRPTPTPRPKPTATSLPTATATSLPTVAPTATVRPIPACAPLACAVTAVQDDWRLLTSSVLLLLITTLWFPAVVLVARVHQRRVEGEQAEKEAMLALLADRDTLEPASADLAGDDLPGEATPFYELPTITTAPDMSSLANLPDWPEVASLPETLDMPLTDAPTMPSPESAAADASANGEEDKDKDPVE